MIEAEFGNWHIECLPEDGGRISVLRYAGSDLLTSAPDSFSKPYIDFGDYENRPVYGYDDCFPTVDPCNCPVRNIQYRDHGELCYINWRIVKLGNRLECSTDCSVPRVSLTRNLLFSENTLTWIFKINNPTGTPIPFLHVMHALMPLRKIQNIEIPPFKEVIEESSPSGLILKSPDHVKKHLLSVSPGNFMMIVLREMVRGMLSIEFTEGLSLTVLYDERLFPSLGIWWNNGGYPDEEGLRRTECAFEPLPGTCSSLEQSYRDGAYLYAEPFGTFSWKINWTINKNSYHAP